MKKSMIQEVHHSNTDKSLPNDERRSLQESPGQELLLDQQLTVSLKGKD
jgi:hypothetical protein